MRRVVILLTEYKTMKEQLECASNESTTLVMYSTNWAWVMGKLALDEFVSYVA
jgi:hypothetical protein